MQEKISDLSGMGFPIILCAVIAACFPTSTCAQDAIYQLKSSGRAVKVGGKITNVSPDGAKIDGKQIPVAEIKRLYFAGEPSEVNRAREQMDGGRLSDAIETLADVDASKLSNRLRAEVDFIRAFSNSQISLRGGNITPQVAGRQVGEFISKHGDSLHLYPAVEQFGKLLFAFDKPDLAAAEFEKLAQCSWPEYQLKGQFQLGKTLVVTGKLAEAESAFDTILALPSNDDLTQSYKQLAKCEKARVIGLRGNLEAGLKSINELIATENSDNKVLFAHLYNALGALYEKSGQIKEARTAYLHTELLFASESEPHAEALFRLANIWLQLDETDRANTARDTLKTRYRNSYWAGKL